MFSLKHLFVNGFSLFPNDFAIISIIPPHRHRHHYHGVLAPNSPLRAKIALLANKEIIPANIAQEKGPFQETSINQDPKTNTEKQDCAEDKKQPSKAGLFRWAKLLARIFEVDPLCCPKCNHPMRIIAFIENPHTIRKILTYINELFTFDPF
ncbi:MAG TPA: hypothetical protein VJK48_02165 [Chlamydiales bacterium]|nr:hypothetical protein [Chlamydiales bacterium]